MSPLDCIVQFPPLVSWFPVGTPGPPMSPQVNPLGQADAGGAVTAATVALPKVAGVVAPVVPEVAARPAR